MNLELRDDNGPRHYLDGKPVSCGTQLQLRIERDWISPRPQVPTDSAFWIYARYEANLHPERVSVCLYTMFGRVYPDDTTVLRWPKEGGAR